MTIHAKAWLPPLEENQGALSLAALIFAIAWGLYEQQRANHAEERRLRRAIVGAEALIFRTFNLLLMWDKVGMPMGVLQTRFRLTASALGAYAQTHAAMPELAIVVLRGSRMFELAAEATSPEELNGRLLEWAESELNSIRAEFATILNRWDHEHAGIIKRVCNWCRRIHLIRFGGAPKGSASLTSGG